MPTASGQTRKAEYGAVIYLCATQDEQLDDVEQRRRDYAGLVVAGRRGHRQ
jgi:hypothetical protein